MNNTWKIEMDKYIAEKHSSKRARASAFHMLQRVVRALHLRIKIEEHKFVTAKKNQAKDQSVLQKYIARKNVQLKARKLKNNALEKRYKAAERVVRDDVKPIKTPKMFTLEAKKAIIDKRLANARARVVEMKALFDAEAKKLREMRSNLKQKVADGQAADAAQQKQYQRVKLANDVAAQVSQWAASNEVDSNQAISVSLSKTVVATQFCSKNDLDFPQALVPKSSNEQTRISYVYFCQPLPQTCTH